MAARRLGSGSAETHSQEAECCPGRCGVGRRGERRPDPSRVPATRTRSRVEPASGGSPLTTEAIGDSQRPDDDPHHDPRDHGPNGGGPNRGGPNGRGLYGRGPNGSEPTVGRTNPRLPLH